MSQPDSIGFVDAGRWAGVAAALADYLQQWLESSPPPLPRGTFAGAQRFLNLVLEGAALDRHERRQPEIPVMAGLLNWTLARGVLSGLPQPAAKPEDMETVIVKHLNCLRRIEAGESDDGLRADASELKSFFLELLQQGNRRRQASYAREEAPLP